MVAEISSSPRHPKHPSTPHHQLRPPLSPSHKNTNTTANSTKPRAKEIPSRYLSPSSSNYSQSTTRPRPQSTTPSVTTTRSLSVSFQGESFSFRTTKPKPNSQNPARKHTNASSGALLSRGGRQRSSLTRSLDCSTEKKGPVLAAVRVLGHSVVFDDKVKRAAFDGEDLYLASDSDSSNSGSQDGSNVNVGGPTKGRAAARGVCVPARFWQESFSTGGKKLGAADAQLVSPRMVNPLKGLQVNAPASIVSFAAEARRAKKGEVRIEEAHSLRLLHNRYLQWRYVNAQAEAALSTQRVNEEKNIYHAWLTISELRHSVTKKRIMLQLLLQYLKLVSILKDQMIYMEKWSQLDTEHYNYLSALTEALKASTLRLPVVNEAWVDIQGLQSAVVSAVDMMQAMGTSIHSLLSKVERTSSLVSELAEIAAREKSLLDQSKDLLSVVAALHVKQCSLQGQMLQLNSGNMVQL